MNKTQVIEIIVLVVVVVLLIIFIIYRTSSSNAQVEALRKDLQVVAKHQVSSMQKQEDNLKGALTRGFKAMNSNMMQKRKIHKQVPKQTHKEPVFKPVRKTAKKKVHFKDPEKSEDDYILEQEYGMQEDSDFEQ